MRLVRCSLVVLASYSLISCLPTTAQKKVSTGASQVQRSVVTDDLDTIPGQKAKFTVPTPLRVPAHPGNTGNEYADRFIAHWNDIHKPENGYFSPEGIPYHSVETLMVEAPDYGHETTSEAYSYWMWLEAAYGKISRDWKPLMNAWESAEAYLIPSQHDQPTAGSYNETNPAVFAPEQDLPNLYPTPLDSSVSVGKDPIAKELRETYGTPMVYGMHWIIDVDNWFGFGRRGDHVSKPAYINTFQRGEQESVWEVVPQPCWDDFQFGGKNGYLDLFVKQNGGYTRQWKYTTAPDADARVVQAMYWAKNWAEEQGMGATLSPLVKKASKMGDYLRYALFDKYFKSQGCQSVKCPAGQDYESAHYLLSWYYAWGGSTKKAGGWSWRIGSSTAHTGYQNPFAAWVLGKNQAFKPLSKNGANDWSKSLDRQLDLYRWLQTYEGAIAGGATNSFRGRHEKFPEGVPTFYKLAYVEAPVYVDPPSNQWFGFQAWTMDRIAQLYFVTGDDRAKVLMDRWVKWVLGNTRLTKDGSFEIPSDLIWSGEPQINWTSTSQNWNGKDVGYNKTLRVKVKSHSQDVGVAGALARTLLFYAAKAEDHDSAKLAKELLDRIWKKYRDEKGVSTPETRVDYKRFNEKVFIPAGWSGRMPNGEVIDSTSTFASLRSKYQSDPAWPQMAAYLAGGKTPIFTYHRFWAQTDVALANATFAFLFPNGIPAPKPGNVSATKMKPKVPVKKAK